MTDPLENLLIEQIAFLGREIYLLRERQAQLRKRLEAMLDARATNKMAAADA